MRRPRTCTVTDTITGADIFFGPPASGALMADIVVEIAQKLPVLAPAKPEGMIRAEKGRKVRGEVIVATGRSNHLTQVNSALCFNFILRGTVGIGSTGANNIMKIDCVEASSDLAKQEGSNPVQAA